MTGYRIHIPRAHNRLSEEPARSKHPSGWQVGLFYCQCNQYLIHHFQRLGSSS